MIAKGNRVSLEYTLVLDDGRVVTTNVGKDPFVYIHGEEQIPAALERQLAGLDVGDHREVTLSPEEAYGPINPEAFISVEIEAVPEEARKPGIFLETNDSDGSTRVVRVHEVHSDHVILDFNHRLAGERLTFQIRVIRIDLVGEPSQLP